MTAVLVALGSNVAPRRTRMEQALQELKGLDEVERIASLYESEPYGEVKQAAFLNSALMLQTLRSPAGLLTTLKKLERRLGRRKRYRWGPREIDLDIIFFGQEVVNTAQLHIPHPDYRNRRFVLQPLVDIAPDFLPPGSDNSLRRLLEKCPDQSALTLIETDWYADERSV